jgi:hypothetical protein
MSAKGVPLAASATANVEITAMYAPHPCGCLFPKFINMLPVPSYPKCAANTAAADNPQRYDAK